MKPILDACCGSKMFHFNKTNPLVHFNDIRKESHTLCDGRQLEINPDSQEDFTNLSFKDESFYLVIFDPPHLLNAGSKGWQAKKYGSLKENWKQMLADGFKECWRVLKPNGTLIFKWNEHSKKVSEITDLFPVKPIVGHKTMQNNKTIWLCYFKGQ